MPSAPTQARTPAERATLDLGLLADATARLLDTCAGLDAAALAEPSRLPGWSRAHLLTHVARNADALRVMLLAARTGATLSPYPSVELRDADIAAGATRPAELILLDVRASAERFAVDADSLDADAWAAQIVMSRPPTTAAAELPGHRLREVAAHHTDLDVGHELADLPVDVAASFLDQLPSRFAGSPLDPAVLLATDLDRRWHIGAGDGPTISGTLAALLPWALGRTAPQGLVSDRGPVPPSPGWG
jgi:maleylpyruvate isomerase